MGTFVLIRPTQTFYERITFASAPNYENPQDANTDNEYLVTVEVSDGTTGQVTQDVAISVTNVDEAPGKPGAPRWMLRQPADTTPWR